MLCALFVAACGSSETGATVAPRAHDPLCNFEATPQAFYRHVLWIWFENTDEHDVVSDSNSGSYTSSLIDRCALAVNYHNLTHPSLPNYIAATSGTVQGAASSADCSPTACPQSQANLFDQVQAAGGQWREYVQSPDQPCSGAPAAYYTTLAPQCGRYEVAMGSTSSGNLRSDIDAHSLPAFAFILPDDAHNSGPSADQFLSDWMRLITASAEYKAGNTAVFITWDEGGTDRIPGEACDDSAHADVTAYPGCQVALIAVAPAAAAARSSEYFTHYSLLRTTEEMLGISTYLGKAASAHSMRAALHL